MLLKSIIENADDETWIRLEGSSYLTYNVPEFQSKDVKENDSYVMSKIKGILGKKVESFRLGFVSSEEIPLLIVKMV